jgi:hypothetical protein
MIGRAAVQLPIIKPMEETWLDPVLLTTLRPFAPA